VDLANILPLPAKRFIESHDGKVFCNSRVEKISADGVFVKGEFKPAKNIIVATNFATTENLLEDIPTELDLNKFTEQTIITIYLQYDPEFSLPKPMLGLVDHTAEWLFDRRITDNPGIIAAVISANSYSDIDNKTLAMQVDVELKELFVNKPELIDFKVIREKKAAFRADLAVKDVRPTKHKVADNIYVCGDYFQTGYPATLEGAVKSGRGCATSMMDCLYPHTKRTT